MLHATMVMIPDSGRSYVAKLITEKTLSGRQSGLVAKGWERDSGDAADD